VLDPTKVVRTALQNAGSIASLMLTPRPWWRSPERKGSSTVADTAAAWKGCTRNSSVVSR